MFLSWVIINPCRARSQSSSTVLNISWQSQVTKLRIPDNKILVEYFTECFVATLPLSITREACALQSVDILGKFSWRQRTVKNLIFCLCFKIAKEQNHYSSPLQNLCDFITAVFADVHFQTVAILPNTFCTFLTFLKSTGGLFWWGFYF